MLSVASHALTLVTAMLLFSYDVKLMSKSSSQAGQQHDEIRRS